MYFTHTRSIGATIISSSSWSHWKCAVKALYLLLYRKTATRNRASPFHTRQTPLSARSLQKREVCVPFVSISLLMFYSTAQLEIPLTRCPWGLYIRPSADSPDGVWPDLAKPVSHYDYKGKVNAELRMHPWILKISCRATDVINTLTITKMRFDPHATCAEAVASVRNRYSHSHHITIISIFIQLLIICFFH